jgi:phosphoenolpyruvate carboxykinase (GTP)
MATYVEKWVEEQARLAKPDKIYWCDGSQEEAQRLVEIGIKEERINGQPIFRELNHREWPHAYWHLSHPTDVARTENLTFVCQSNKETAGPNNNWMDPGEAKKMLTGLTDGCMRGRTMYVLPYMMGHPDSPYAKACVQLTDVTYVAVSMRIMTRMSREVLDKIGNSEIFVKGLHSVGDFDPSRRFIMHFPNDSLVWSIGSGYGGNALLGKKCFSLRLASWLGLQEGWLAEHMIIIGIEAPDGKIDYLLAALPSACGKTNLAMLQSVLPGYKIWTLGDDIAWLNIGPDGRLYAINPEAGFFGVAPGTSMKTNPNMIRTLRAGNFYPVLFTNTGLNTDTNEPWWEGLTDAVPPHILDWQGKTWTPASEGRVDHPNSRFTVSIKDCPTVSPEIDNPKGVPITAILFGGKRSQLLPLVYESFNWEHGVFCGARMGSETTAAAIGREGVLRRDPMAMLPFCGYNMADYFRHWLAMGSRMTQPPKIFSINWFRRDEEGKFLWPGFGENIRVLKWAIDRSTNPDQVGARETPIGLVPDLKDFTTEGLDVSRDRLASLFEVNPADWDQELADIREFLGQFGDRVPEGIQSELAKMEKSLKR